MPEHDPAQVPPAPLPARRASLRRGLLILGALVGAGLAAWMLQRLGDVPREAVIMGGILVLAAVLWVSEALPLFVTSLLVIFLQATLLANPGNWPGLGFESRPSPSYRDIFSLAADPVLVLFFGGFVLAAAAVKEGVDRAMSSVLLAPFGGSPRAVLLGLMLVTLLFGMWMSNTATATMMLALTMPMLAALPPSERFRKALVLSIPIAANIGGMSTPVASPPNAVAMGFLRDLGHTVRFIDWMLVAVPLAVTLTLLAWLVLWQLYRPVSSGLRLTITRRTLSARGWCVVVVFTATVLLWMSEPWHGLPAAIVALTPALILPAMGIFTGADLARIEWRVLILIAGGISLGTGMQATGLDQWLARSLPQNGGQWVLAALLLATLIVGTFMSNTAAANLFLPIGLSSASLAHSQADLHPIQVAMSIAMAASLSMALPISTPPNALAYAHGEFTTRDLIRVTVLISGIGALLIILCGQLVMRFWRVIV